MNDTIVYAAADTLADNYYQSWSGVDAQAEAGMFIQIMSSNDLIFVVLTVSLIIWFVLAFYLIRVDRKLDALEKKLSVKGKPSED
ncbi:MAG: hypothetical protein LAT75_07020 [Candidatus Cyclonatronum sp.]|uniref:CcmD family protein n=1 Tax=Cyclonatronum sp. TaxID=3024185 RepID=UPI0025B9302F|nr:hypothetical protein [Cyclonatronum sp.]MCC5932921.1 hypothetical protein [Balneolales bacterium]MCH8486600.1 hypothetical protein [Cyclonatronum sp.]